MIVQNIALAVGNKNIENYYKTLPEFHVINIFKKREKLLDDVLKLKELPSFLIISDALPGKMDFKEIITQIRTLRPTINIVFLYGEPDQEYMPLAEFLIQNGVFAIVTELNEVNLYSALTADYSKENALKNLTHVKQQMLKQKAVQDEPVAIIKEVEKTVIQTQIIGTIKIGVASLFPRAGCTHFSLELAAYLAGCRKDIGVVVAEHVYNALKDYYLINQVELQIQGVNIYHNLELAINRHKCIIYDIGMLNSENEKIFYSLEYKILMCPSQPWEIDSITNFLATSPFAKRINFIYYPIAQKLFEEIALQYKRNDINVYKYNQNPQPLFDDIYKESNNTALFETLTKDILQGIGEVKAEKRIWPWNRRNQTAKM